MTRPNPYVPAGNGPPRSIFTRLARWAAGFALLSLALLFAVTVWQISVTSERSLSATVDTDIAGLADIYATSGEAELLNRLDDRSSLLSFEGRQSRYMLVRPDETILGGDVKDWPDLGAALSEEGYVTLSDGTDVFARATRISPDLNLLVARTYERDWSALTRLSTMFLSFASLIVVATWALSYRASQSLRDRIDEISGAFRTAEAGREVDLPIGGRDDEIGELAQLSTQAISRSAGLARMHRHMSDNIAHEIRTPLSHLDSRLVSAMRELPDGVDPSLIDDCRKDIKGVVTMLDSLLDIASSEARVGDRSGLEEVDLSALITDLADLYSGSAEEAGITLRTAADPNIVMMGEAMQLTRLISNLLDNALKYVPSGGQITISVAQGPVIEVRDDGPGIDPALRPQIFDRFRTGGEVQGKSSHGLGLALARAIALRHSLRIVLVDSKVGAHFVIKPHALWADGEAKS